MAKVTRRGFLAFGAATAALTALPSAALSTAAGSASARARATARAGLGRGSPYALASWQGLAGQSLRVRLRSRRATTVRLAKVTDFLAAGASASDGESFGLSFAGAAALPGQGTYTLRHDALGEFPMFLSAPGTDGTVTAVVNRIPHQARR